MRWLVRTAVVPVAILLLGFAQAGCGSATYRVVKAGEITPAAPLELKSETEGLELAVTGLIYYDGPGSWKEHAYWDEYLVQVTNHRTEAVAIESIVLGDTFERVVDPGRDPKVLEKSGLERLRYLNNLNTPTNVPDKMTAGYVIGGLLKVGTLPNPVGPFIATFSALGIAAVAGPVWLVNTVAVDPKQSKWVQAEIDRRRLALPLTVAPGATAQGSLFFPLTPGPQRLIIKGRIGETPAELILDLKVLSGLHLTTTEKQPPPRT